MSRSQARETVAEPAAPAPRANPDLLGHEAAEAELRRLFDSGRMPHALLLSGPRGIGKATLAFRLARFVLAQGGGEGSGPSLFGEDTGPGLAIPPESGTFRRVTSGGHADLFTLERGYDRRGRLRTVITVDDTREIEKFLHLTSAEGGWRVVVIDGADEMNPNAANAVLKILEEPPRRSLLLLVAQSTGRLLPTIRSRCRKMALAALDPVLVRQLLARFCPEVEERQADAVAVLANGSIGRALDLAAAGGVELYRAVLALLDREAGIDPAALHAFADRLSRREADQSYRVVEDVLSQLLARLAITAAEGAPGSGFERAGETPAVLSNEIPILRRLGGRAPAARWAALRGEIEESFARTDGLNLDRKQTILGAFFAIERAAG
jgi:DNA polymerase-3 subunit delta'